MTQYPGIEYLNQQPQWDGTFSSGTERPLQALRLLGNPQDKVPAIHVAGTNGKGTTCTTISNILISAGYRVGQHSSPHLVDVTERCIVQGVPISAEHFDSALTTVRRKITAHDIRLTFFELSSIASFLIFAELKLDWIVVEVGLGGRWDATNVMARPRATVLTSVSLDHTRLLGTTHQLIAREKTQIFRPDVSAFIGVIDSETRNEVDYQSTRIGCPIYHAGDDYWVERDQIIFGERVLTLPVREAGLFVEHQRQNATLSAVVAAGQGIDEGAIRDGIIATRWPGRLEGFAISNSRGRQVSVLTDGAHNPDGVHAFGAYLERVVDGVNSGERIAGAWAENLAAIKRLIFVVSILTTKEANEMLSEIENHARHLEQRCGVTTDWIFTESGHRLSNPAQLLREQFGRGVTIADAESALSEACELADEKTLVVVTGSLYLLGKLRPRLTQLPFSTRAESSLKSRIGGVSV